MNYENKAIGNKNFTVERYLNENNVTYKFICDEIVGYEWYRQR
jgi:hypothetical protein